MACWEPTLCCLGLNTVQGMQSLFFRTGGLLEAVQHNAGAKSPAVQLLTGIWKGAIPHVTLVVADFEQPLTCTWYLNRRKHSSCSRSHQLLLLKDFENGHFQLTCR